MTHEEKALEEAKRNRMYARLYGPNQRWQEGLEVLRYGVEAFRQREFTKYRISLTQKEL